MLLVIILLLPLRSPFGTTKKYNKASSGLEHVPVDVPRDVTSVGLCCNRISKIASNTFRGLSKCLDLSLHSNRIDNIEIGVFTGLNKLNVLWLFQNKQQFSNLACSMHGLLKGCYLQQYD